MTLESFEKKKDFLICVDSDGCAMDTMDIKHFRCFGPCMVEEWGLDEWREELLNRWNEINLYTMTRGVNRFVGLSMILTEVDEAYVAIPGLADLKKWVEESDELSNTALEHKVQETGSECLKKALSWSKKTNEAIGALPEEEKKPFPGVKEALEYAHRFADVAIVSSANLQAVEEEWTKHGFTDYVDILCAQNAGSKAYCIQELVGKGYDKTHVLMTGDAPGDLKAAEKNGVFFYPILVKREGESWEEFRAAAVGRLLDGTFGAYQEEKKREFYDNLS